MVAERADVNRKPLGFVEDDEEPTEGTLSLEDLLSPPTEKEAQQRRVDVRDPDPWRR